MIYIVAACIALLAADRIETEVNSESSMVTFTFFSTVFLGMLILLPENYAVIAALLANVISSMTRKQPFKKRLVNTLSVTLSILAAVSAYTIFGGSRTIETTEILSIIAAGVAFSIVNFVSLSIMISLVTKQSLLGEFKNYYIVMVLEMLPPIFAGLTALIYYFNPIIALVMLVSLTVLFRPHYEIPANSAVPKPRWNVSPYKAIIPLSKDLENVGK